MQRCLVNLVDLNPPVNGGTSRIAREVSRVLIDRSRAGGLDLLFVVGWGFANHFRSWLGEDVWIFPYVFPFDRIRIARAFAPTHIISPLFGLEPFQALKKPHIASVPDTLPMDHPEMFPNRRLLERRRNAYRYLSRAHTIVTLSHFARQRLLAHTGLSPEQVTVITLGADLNVEAVPMVLPEHYVFYPANAWPHKRHQLLLEAMRAIWERAPTMHLVLTGGQRSALVQQLTDDYRLIMSDPRVLDLGYVTDGQLQTLYSNATALLFTSAYEGFGMPLVEAMRNGCPVICAPLTSIPEIANDAALYVASDDPADWANALLEQLPRQRATLIERGLRNARHYTWQNARQEWHRVFERAGIGYAGEFTETVPCPPPAEMHSSLSKVAALFERFPVVASRSARLTYLARHGQALRRAQHAILRMLSRKTEANESQIER
ncbi:MAG: glycosyltransferase family 1 protein [Aggregatilineales bacterium]